MEVYLAIWRHREPQVVRVSAVRMLTARLQVDVEVLLVSGVFIYLGEDFDVPEGHLFYNSAVRCNIDEQLLGTGGDHTGDVKGESTDILKTWRSNSSFLHRSPLDWTIVSCHFLSQLGDIYSV